jgi:large subunit ribosomal protein L16
MLSPKKMKFRKQSKGRVRGPARGGAHLAFGDFGIMATENGRINARQIEAARIAMTRHIKRGGKVWIKVFPHHPVTKKPAEVRMGKGKGSVDRYEARVHRGRVLYEMHGVDQKTAIEALTLAAAKLPISTKLIICGQDPWVLDNKEKLSEKAQAKAQATADSVDSDAAAAATAADTPQVEPEAAPASTEEGK